MNRRWWTCRLFVDSAFLEHQNGHMIGNNATVTYSRPCSKQFQREENPKLGRNWFYHSLVNRNLILAGMVWCLMLCSTSQGQSVKDLWDVAQGIRVTGVSPNDDNGGLYPENIFGARLGDIEPGNTVFADNAPPGYVHWVEWQTREPVTIGDIQVFARGDGTSALNQREFGHLQIWAKATPASSFSIPLVSFTPTHPYNSINAQSGLILDARISPVTAQVFRAEFTHWAAGFKGYDAPRVIELDAFPPVPEPTAKTLLGASLCAIGFARIILKRRVDDQERGCA
jgi:hypothetical protein